MDIRFDDRVAIVTGAGNGLGRQHALGLAARGARVVVNDLGQDGRPSPVALEVVKEIEAAGGKAMADPADVSDEADVARMVAAVMDRWGRIDILVNNAGILRDKTFAKMELADFRKVVDIHLMGSVNCTSAVWGIMRDQSYGRIVLTSSASGIYGNFGQSNYGAAKAAMLGLMNVLHLEGAKSDIRVNTLAPTAATGMTEGLISPEDAALLAPETVTPGLLYLVSEDAPSRVILGAGGGAFAVTHIEETAGHWLPPAMRTPETVRDHFAAIDDRSTRAPLDNAFGQTNKFIMLARAGLKGEWNDA